MSNLFYNNKIFKNTVRQLIQIDSTKDISSFNRMFSDVFNILESSIILSVLHDSFLGVKFINEHLEEQFLNYFSDYTGIPIIITKNDYSLNLFNGEIGFLINYNNEKKAVFKLREDFIILDINLLPEFSVAFSISVHKSQGSEFDKLLLILPDNENNKLLSKEIIYTGITRAKNQLYIYGNLEIFKYAISKKSERQSGLNLWE